MSGLGLRLLAGKLRRRPLAAIGGLLTDYATYVGMVAFGLFLALAARPLAWLDRRMGWSIRARIITWVARRARG